jgi:ectoine hydroxylase-related dioxygenase (phytanoyl-CoA dioxygenase family)
MSTRLADRIRFRGAIDQEAVLDRVASDGIAVIDDFLTENEVAATRKAIEALFAQRHEGDFSPNKSRVKRLMKNDLAGSLQDPVINEIAQRPLVQRCRRDFFDPYKSRLDALYVMHYVDEMPTNEQFHSDGTPTFKVFVYLNDVDETNGAFVYDIGSHREGYFRMMCNYYEGKLTGTAVPNREVRNPVSVVGKRGTAILFNPLGIHRGGFITPGTERVTITYFFNSDERNLRTPKLLRRIFGRQMTNLTKYNRAHQSEEYHIL